MFGAMSPDGELLAAQFDGDNGNVSRVVDRQFNVVAEFNEGGALAYAWDPAKDLLYFVLRGTNEFVAVSTDDYEEVFRIDYGSDFDSTTRMTVSDDGFWAFMPADNGILMIPIPAPGSGLLAGKGACLLGGRRRR